MSTSASPLLLVVGFILTATGVHTSCPIELSPSTVVVRYGDTVSINCSTSHDQVDGMGWEAPQAGTGVERVKHLTWAVENLTDWTIAPSCFIDPVPHSSIDQCTKSPKIVLYTFPKNINIRSISDSDVMTENKEYAFKCDIQHVAPVQNLTVRWYKGDTIIHMDTFDNPIKEPVDQSSVYNFITTRADNGVTLRCEAQMDLGPKGPQLNVSSQEYNITVHFGPHVQCTHVFLTEGETLEGQCDVKGNPTPHVRWLKDGQTVNLSAPLSRENAGIYNIKAEGSSFVNQPIEVFVWYGPELKCPSTYTSLEYAPHNISCTVEGYPKPQTAWFKDNEEVEFPHNLTRSDAGQYVIIASNGLSSVNSTMDINVVYPPSQIFELEDAEVEVGSNLWLKCSSTGNPRPKYLWDYYRTDNVMEESEDGVSRLHIRNATAYNRGFYMCRASNERGSISKTARVTVRGAEQKCPLEITPDRMVIGYKNTSQYAKCKVTSADGNVKEKYWQDTMGIKTYNESLLVDTHKDWNLTHVCTATFVGIGTCQKLLNVTLYKAPDSVFISSVHNLSSLMEDKEFQLQCNIINVAPVQSLTVQWYRENNTFEPLIKGSMQVTGCLPENNTNCDISVIRSPVNVSSTISIIMKREDRDAQFRCEAQLNLGPEGPPNIMSSPLNVTVYYKPIINTTKLPKTIPVFRGYTEDLVCEADGHPPPKIQWLYGSENVLLVSGNTLAVQAAGFYNCTATNEFGSSFHVVEGILKEDYLPLIAGFVAVTVVAISVIFLSIYSIYYKNTKMRRYSLKNPKLRSHNGNVAHNGWDLQFPMTKLS